ncbi:hypothetical protein Tco_0400079 [Tanacetum coccineum]
MGERLNGWLMGSDSLNIQAIFDNLQLMGSLCTQVSAQAKEIKALKTQVKKLKKGVKPLITHHKAWIKSVALKTRLARKTSLKKKGVQKELSFDDLDDDAMDYMETKDAQDEGRTSFVVLEEKESVDKEVSTEAPVSTVKPNEGFCQEKLKGYLTSKMMNKQKEKEKGVEIRNLKDTERPRPTSTRSMLTLKPLPKIDLKDKGKKMIDERGGQKGSRRNRKLKRKNEEGKELKKEISLTIDTQELEFSLHEIPIDAHRKFLARTKKEGEDTATAKVPAEQEVTEQGTKKRKSGHVKMIARKRPRPQPDDDSDDEHRKCLRIITFESTIDSEIMETKSFIARLHKVSSPDGNYLVIYRVNGHFRAFNYLMEGDLKIMMESSTEENDQELKDGTVIYMLVERRYPLSKELLQQMIDLGLEVEEESTAALQLVRFIKQ